MEGVSWWLGKDGKHSTAEKEELPVSSTDEILDIVSMLIPDPVEVQLLIERPSLGKGVETSADTDVGDLVTSQRKNK